MIKGTARKFAKKLGLSYDNKINTIFGKYKGFDIALEIQSKVKYAYYLYINVRKDGHLPSVDELKNAFWGDKSISNVIIIKNKVVVKLASVVPITKQGDSMMNALDTVTTYFLQNGYVNTCQGCLETKGLLHTSINGNATLLCEECYSNVGVKQNQKSRETKKENVIIGILGSLLGSFLGMILMIFLSQFNYVADISAVLIILFAIVGYTKFSGAEDSITGVIASTIFAVIMTFVGSYLAGVVSVYIESIKVGYLSVVDIVDIIDVYPLVEESLNDLLKSDLEVQLHYFYMLVRRYLFVGCGVIVLGSQAFEKFKKGNKIYKMN